MGNKNNHVSINNRQEIRKFGVEPSLKATKLEASFREKAKRFM